jgi:2,4-dienoyl-CoA reductase (NADPH2)
MPGGHTVEESKIVVQALEKAGVRLINCYTGWHESPIPTVAPSLPKGAFAHLAAAIRSAVGIPVIAANRINDPFIAEKILAAGQADLVGMGRALLADPELPVKAKTGRVDEIVPCIACSRCLGEILSIYKTWGECAGAFCTVNPLAGKEGACRLKPAATQKKVFIVGGGPAGL